MDRPWRRVPTWVGAALRPELAGATDEIIEAVRAEVPEYARPLEGRFGRRIVQGVSVALEQFADLLGSDAALADTRVYRALGQLEHREGRTLAALQSAYQVGSRTAWRRIGDSAPAHRLPPDVIFGLAEALFTYLEQLSAASVAGWAEEDARRAGSVQTRRHALVELLSRRPPAAEVEVERLAAEARWRLPERLAALVVEDAVVVAGRLPGAIGAELEPAGVVLVSTPDAPGALDRLRAATAGRPGVLGPVVGWAQTHRSVLRAQTAWSLHAAGLLGDAAGDPLVRTDRHLLALLLAAEPELAGELCDRALAPLRALPAGAAHRAVETLRAWLDAHGDVTAAAAALHVHPQTVRYRLSGLRDTFAGALDEPGARLELAIALRTAAHPVDAPAATGPATAD
jgi:hypothetical protein